MDVKTMRSNDVATNKAKLMVYMEHEIKNDLERLAELHNRSMSNYVETLIMQAVANAKQSGILK